MRTQLHFQQTIIKLILTVIFLAGSIPVFAAPPADTPDTPTPVLAVLPADRKLDAVLQAARSADIRVRHIFPPDAFIAEVPSGVPTNIPGAQTFVAPVDLAGIADWTPTAQRAATVFNALLAPPITGKTAQSLDAHPLQPGDFVDAMEAPAPQTPRFRTENTTADDLRPDYTESSQFMIGSVAVGIIFPESNGATDPSTENWTDAKQSQVVSEIASALDWWAAREPKAQLSVVYDAPHTEPTAVEPISRPYTDQSLWITDAMTAMGFSGYSYFDQVREYNDYLRKTYQTDWAFTIFVIDSANDSDNRFSDGYFAYAYIGGPFMVMTYGNNGYGISNMDAVAAHEMGHIFRALDQYAAANVACDVQSGYLQIENQNSQQGCATDEPSIMRGQISPYANGQIDRYARGQIGWWDSDGNGILDPVDVGLTVSNVSTATVTATGVFTISGHFAETPFPSPKYRDILINSVETVNYRVDDGIWQPVQPVDGAFDDYQEDFTFITDPLPNGVHTIYLQTIDNFGKVNEQSIITVTVSGVAETVDTEFSETSGRLTVQSAAAIDPIAGTALQLTDGAIAGVEYRLDGGAWQSAQPADGAFDSAGEDFIVPLNTATLAPGNHLLEARAADTFGNVDATPAQMTVSVEAGQFRIFLPLVVR